MLFRAFMMNICTSVFEQHDLLMQFLLLYIPISPFLHLIKSCVWQSYWKNQVSVWNKKGQTTERIISKL